MLPKDYDLSPCDTWWGKLLPLSIFFLLAFLVFPKEREIGSWTSIYLPSFPCSSYSFLFLRFPLPLSLRRSGGVQAVGQTIRMLSQWEGDRGWAAALRYLPAPSALWRLSDCRGIVACLILHHLLIDQLLPLVHRVFPFVHAMVIRTWCGLQNKFEFLANRQTRSILYLIKTNGKDILLRRVIEISSSHKKRYSMRLLFLQLIFLIIYIFWRCKKF